MTKPRLSVSLWRSRRRPSGTRCIRKSIGRDNRLKSHYLLSRILSPALALCLILLAILGCRSTNKKESTSWAKAKVLADKEDHPSKIIVDGEAVYFVTGGTVASQREGTNNIKRISLKDGAVSILVKGGDLVPQASLAVDDKYLYWSDGGNIYRVPKQEGASEKIIPNAPQPDEMVLDEQNIYWLIWTGEGSPPQPIMYASKKGGEAKQLTPPQPPTSGIALDGDFVFFMTGEGLKKISKAGGAIIDVYKNPQTTPTLQLQQDPKAFYFCQMNSMGKSFLTTLDKKNGEVKQLGPVNHTMEFVVSDGWIYYFQDVAGEGSFGPVALMRVATIGSYAVVIDRGNAGWVKHLAVDTKQIYFTDISKVYALPK